MQTNFTPQQLADPDMRESEKILRTCVHCGFCTATCPTYLLLGDELDSPRGRIYLMKEMLEKGKPATEPVVKHIDRCLSCLSCVTTCPSGVDYMHLVDHARAHIERTYRRPFGDRVIRAILARVLPNPALARLALIAARVVKPGRALFARMPGGERLAAMLDLAPTPAVGVRPAAARSVSVARPSRRVAIVSGCIQRVMAPSINEAAISLLARHGVEAVLCEGEACCGALVHHMGREEDALRAARRNIEAWTQEMERNPFDAILVTTSGCGTTIKDYGHMLRHEPGYADRAASFSRLTKDITEYLSDLELAPSIRATGYRVAYHSACSMQHGQRITDQPKRLLRKMGFDVRDVPEGHICCGSAGVYNILQPEIAGRLRARKVANIEKTRPQIIATGNLGCMLQIARGTSIPIVHTVELLDWATGGRTPHSIASIVG